MKRVATTEYSTTSGVGAALMQEGKARPLRVGVIGLGGALNITALLTFSLSAFRELKRARAD